LWAAIKYLLKIAQEQSGVVDDIDHLRQTGRVRAVRRIAGKTSFRIGLVRMETPPIKEKDECVPGKCRPAMARHDLVNAKAGYGPRFREFLRQFAV